MATPQAPVWSGTSPIVLAGDVNIGGLISVLLMIARVVLAIGLFAHSLPRRDHFAVRLAIATASVFAVHLAVMLACVSAFGVDETRYFFGMLIAFSVLLGLCVLAFKALFRASRSTTLFCVTAGYTVQNLASGTSELGALLMPRAGIDPTVPSVYLTTEVFCIAIVFLGVHALLSSRIDREGLAQVENEQMLMMMPVVSLAIIGLDLLIKSLTSLDIGTGHLALLRCFHGLSCVAVLWVEYQMLYRSRIELDAQVNARLAAERDRQLEVSRETIDAINIKCHDLKHQIRTLAKSDGGVPANVLQDLARDVRIYDSSVKTGNEALDTVLTQKRLLCEQRGITLTCIADGAALDFMAPSDIYALFGNALDNAMDAVCQIDDEALRSITLAVRRTMGCASIHVENYCTKTPHFADGLPLTTKEDRANHGFGVRSMRATAQRYGGTFSASAEEGTFRVDVMLPLP